MMTVYSIAGMTCGHCVSAVSAEVGEVPGVTKVRVDLGSGEMTVTSDGPLEEQVVHAAVREAGYEVITL